jgi:DNA modification methylase/ribosomal protein S27AE
MMLLDIDVRLNRLIRGSLKNVSQVNETSSSRRESEKNVMVEKFLGRMEVEKGFIQIPTKSLNELTGDMPKPSKTLLNGETARLDSFGRLWSSSLKGKFPLGSQIQLTKTKEGFQVELVKNASNDVVSMMDPQTKTELSYTPKTEKTLDYLLNITVRRERKPYFKVIQAKPHTPVYMMHKFWARRPHNVFAELIAHSSELGDIVLDPFCGGGVTVVEALGLRRKVVGIDLNPLATYVTEMEVSPLNVDNFWQGFLEIKKKLEPELSGLYRTSCPKCQSKMAVFDWLEWEGEKPTRMKLICPNCGIQTKEAEEEDVALSKRIEENFEKIASQRQFWYPKTAIPNGDKTEGIIKDGYTHFWQLFTIRNLLVLSILYKEISAINNKDIRKFLMFAFSSSLKWASKQSHLRGEIVEGWAMHAYWLYPKTLEINVWNTFFRRCTAVARGKKYGNENIGTYYRKAQSFKDLLDDKGTCLLLTQSSTNLPIPDEMVDVIVTDPPYGGNVNYGELADYWIVWHNKDEVIDKTQEIIVNKNQRKGLTEYEEGLTQVFKECYRVLKKGGNMIVTFNSRKLHVVASFVIAATRDGFVLHPEGLLYQPPIRAYTTTFHAMQIGAFIGDFVFTFYKPSNPATDMPLAETEISDFKEHIDGLIKNHIGERITEPELREKAYRSLIPFLALHARTNLSACREAVRFFEEQMKKLEPHFKELREEIIEERRKKYLSKRMNYS